jgi:Alpha-kinase family
VSPHLEGAKFEKISGDTGEISPNWRSQGIKLQRITRTLDAFQHFVVAKSDESLLIADLQGKTQANYLLYCAYPII